VARPMAVSANTRATASRTRLQRRSTVDCSIISLLSWAGVRCARAWLPGENGLPVTLHVYDRPVLTLGLVERLVTVRSMRCGRRYTQARIRGGMYPCRIGRTIGPWAQTDWTFVLCQEPGAAMSAPAQAASASDRGGTGGCV
jgi:hypothetical protein